MHALVIVIITFIKKYPIHKPNVLGSNSWLSNYFQQRKGQTYSRLPLHKITNNLNFPDTDSIYHNEAGFYYV